MMRGRKDFELTMTIGIFVFTFLLSYAHGVSYADDIPRIGYCASKYPALACCDGRQDECSAPILDTICYCDDFCNRTQSSDDCCPDYWSHCRGMVNTGGPQPIRRCYYKGSYYNERESMKDNCKKCTCTGVRDRNDEVEMLCEEDRCLVEEDLLDDLNLRSSRLGWRAANHSEFWGRTLSDGITLRLGTLDPASAVTEMMPIPRLYNPNNLPREFDSNEHWPNYISEIRDQGWCGSSWAISAVDIATDRYAIMSKGREAVKLATQHLLSCNDRGQQGCNGGHLDRAWMFMYKYGLVDEDCYPWTGHFSKCTLPRHGRGITLRQAKCRRVTKPSRTRPYRVGPSYLLGNETDIMNDILTSGPVQATMKVYQDFFIYKSGVYKHSPLAERYRTGHHSVRIVGWGEELSSYGPPVKYWVVANSWGKHWGENGYFRIVRGTNECEIEKYVLATWAQTSGK